MRSIRYKKYCNKNVSLSYGENSKNKLAIFFFNEKKENILQLLIEISVNRDKIEKKTVEQSE